MQKVLWLIVAFVLVAGGVLLGFMLSKDDPNANGQASTNSGSQAVTTPPADRLDLSSKGLTKVGADIYNKTNVTELILSDNNLQTLPTELGKMTSVEILKLDHNRLDDSLIGEVRKMPLRVLDVSNNNMTGVPAEIGQLNKLESLDYSNNHITELPSELANLKNNLKEFNLTGNPLSQNTLNKLKAALPNTNIIF